MSCAASYRFFCVDDYYKKRMNIIHPTRARARVTAAAVATLGPVHHFCAEILHEFVAQVSNRKVET